MSLLFKSVSDGETFDMNFITSNRNYGMGDRNTYEPDATGHGGYITHRTSFIADLDTNDTAYCRFNGGESNTIGGGATHAHFEGVLLC